MRRRELKMQRFKSAGSAQKFLSSDAAVYNTFNVPRHLVSAPAYRVLRADALATWRTAAAIASQLLRRRRSAFDARRRDEAL
jgi:hypothetical protein